MSGSASSASCPGDLICERVDAISSAGHEEAQGSEPLRLRLWKEVLELRAERDRLKDRLEDFNVIAMYYDLDSKLQQLCLAGDAGNASSLFDGGLQHWLGKVMHPDRSQARRNHLSEMLCNWTTNNLGDLDSCAQRLSGIAALQAVLAALIESWDSRSGLVSSGHGRESIFEAVHRWNNVLETARIFTAPDPPRFVAVPVSL